MVATSPTPILCARWMRSRNHFLNLQAITAQSKQKKWALRNCEIVFEINRALTNSKEWSFIWEVVGKLAERCLFWVLVLICMFIYGISEYLIINIKWNLLVTKPPELWFVCSWQKVCRKRSEGVDQGNATSKPFNFSTGSRCKREAAVPYYAYRWCGLSHTSSFSLCQLMV